ncbi:MAG: DUF4212 domain-containing protein [Alphaproteobacteria bacterium]|nr:DUF4212 domain-containing protein [Alphaproteobacteria bacterium]
MSNESERQAYWRHNIRILAQLLAVWFIVSFGFGILLADVLNQFSIFGIQLGFWFAQQGSIFVFIVLIFVYSARMRQIERKFGVEETPPAGEGEGK